MQNESNRAQRAANSQNTARQNSSQRSSNDDSLTRYFFAMGIAICIGLTLGITAAVWRPSTQVEDELVEQPFGSQLAMPRVSVSDDSPQIIRRTSENTSWRMFYATNREVLENSHRSLRFGDRARDLQFGLATIQVPASHQRGVREPPKSWLPFHPQTLREGIIVKSSRLVEDSVLVRGIQTSFARMAEPELLIVVHGYNVSHQDALTRTCQIAHDLPFRGSVLAFTWPSAGRVDRYFQDAFNAEFSESEFAELIEYLRDQLPPETKLHVLAHSMGNRVVLGGLSKLAASESQGNQVTLHNLILAAPDVGHRKFEQQLERIDSLVQNVTLYTSIRDGALVLSQAINGEARAGQQGAVSDVVRLDTIDVTSVDTDLLGHSYYGSSEAVLNDVFYLLRTARKPEAASWFELRSQSDDSGYWAFTQIPPMSRFIASRPNETDSTRRQH